MDERLKGRPQRKQRAMGQQAMGSKELRTEMVSQSESG